MNTSRREKMLLVNPNTEEARVEPPQLAIPDIHYAAIGQVTDAWADLEFEGDRVIWDLMGVQQPFGACLSSQIISIHPKLKALRALLHLWNADELADEIGSFAGSMYELADPRNRTVHDKRFMTYPGNEVVRFEITTTKRLAFRPTPEELVTLYEIRDRIYSKLDCFNEIRSKIRVLLRTSPDTPRRPLQSIREARDHNVDQTADALVPPYPSGPLPE
jgi:hypothetical protein